MHEIHVTVVSPEEAAYGIAHSLADAIAEANRLLALY
jgi:hypothetical protein